MFFNHDTKEFNLCLLFMFKMQSSLLRVPTGLKIPAGVARCEGSALTLPVRKIVEKIFLTPFKNF
jgi:hypothetical protein